LFTGLFGWYVIKIINSNKQKQLATVASPAQTPVTTPSPTIHHKKKHKIKTEAPVIHKPTVLSKDTVIHHSIRPAPVITVKPSIARPDTAQNQSFSITYLQANATGVIYLHEQPNYTSAVLSKIPDHSKVIVVEKGRQFYKVTFEDQTGYVPKWTVSSP
jgi:hypothetical protein